MEVSVSQLTLFPPPETTLPVKLTTAERFEAFHAANPHVYRCLREKALELRRQGITRWGIKGLWEVVRWSRARTTGDFRKLNNNFPAFYARLLMRQEPELAGFFETRGD